MPQIGTVTTNLLNVRSGAGTFAKIITGLKRGQTVEVLEAVNDEWSKIKLSTGTIAYTATAYLNIVDVPDESPIVDEPQEPAFEPFKVVIATKSLNVRSGPGTNYGIIGKLTMNSAVTVLEELGEWYRTSYADGKGHVHASFTHKLAAGEKVTRGYLIEDEELMSIPLLPDKVIPTDDLEPRKRPEVAARIWNENGGLIRALADRYDIPVAAIVGVIGTESAGKFFDPDTSILTVRFEIHLFHRFWGKLNQALFDRHFQFESWRNHKFRASSEDEWEWVHNGQEREHEVLAFARKLDDTAALKSISMGGPQIMGFNYARLGYESVQQMYNTFARSAHAQILGLFDFVKGANETSDAIEALRKRDFFTFASHYNGTGLEATYEERMSSFAAYFDQLFPNAVDRVTTEESTTDDGSGGGTDGETPSVDAPVDVVAPPGPEPLMAIPTAGLNFRDATNGNKIGLLQKRVPVKILEDYVEAYNKMSQPASAKQWLHLENTDGKQGYAAAWYLEPSRELTDAEKGVTEEPPIDNVETPEETGPLAAVPTTDLNFRDAANGNKIGFLDKGVPVKILEDYAAAYKKMGQPASADQWIHLEDADGKQGYAAAWYLEPSRELTDAEKGVTEEPTTEQPTTEEPAIEEPTTEEPPVVIIEKPEETTTVSAIPTTGINFRDAANGNKIGFLKKGVPLKILEDTDVALEKMAQPSSADQWLHVENSDGKQGYAAAWFMAPSHHLTQAGVDAYINQLPDVDYPTGYEYLWSQQEKLGLPDPFDVLPVQIDTEDELVNMQVNGYGPNTFAFWYWRNWYSRIGGMHNGYDFIVKTGTPLLAVSDGVIIKNWIFMASRAEITTALWCFLPEQYRDSQGRRMMSNLLVAYGHCSSNKERDHLEVVNAGDVIALSGTPAGTNTNDHLHYEVHMLTGDMDLPNRRYPRKLLSVYDREQPMDNNTPWNPLLFYSKRLVNYQIHQGNTIGYLNRYPDYPTVDMMKARGVHHLPQINQLTLGYYRYGVKVIWNKPSSGTWQNGIIPTEMLRERIDTFEAFEPYEASFLTD